MNPNLLSITTIPISIEVNITNGKFENSERSKPKIDIQQTNGGFQIDARPTEINIDTYAARSSMGYGEYNNTDFIGTEAQKGIKLAYQGTAKIVNEGNSLAQGAKPSDIAAQNNRAGATIETVMEFLPKEGADVTFDKGTLNINYNMGNTNISWEDLQMNPLSFTPGTVEINVRERPSVKIEYIGEPIYVPASANPNYEPPVLDVTG